MGQGTQNLLLTAMLYVPFMLSLALAAGDVRSLRISQVRLILLRSPR